MAAATTLSGATTDLTGLDGFTVSSSQRPFHGAVGSGGAGSSNGGGGGSSQFSAQCHNTWPTADTDFSWSQMQVRAGGADGVVSMLINCVLFV